MYLYAFTNHTEIVETTLSNKREQLTKRVNRADNFINLTLLGVEKCLGDMKLEENTNLYISSHNGNMNATMKILDAIFRKKQLPMPFNFLNSVNASILFFVAKNFGIEGKALFVDSFESALTQAFVDVQNGKMVLLGNVNEAMSDVALHRQKFKVTEVIEESQWLVVSPKIEGKKAIAKISDLKIESSEEKHINRLSDLFSFLENQNAVGEEGSASPFLYQNLSFIVTKC